MTIDPSRSVKEKIFPHPTPFHYLKYILFTSNHPDTSQGRAFVIFQHSSYIHYIIVREFFPCLESFSAGTYVFCCIFLTSNTTSFSYQIIGSSFKHAFIATRAPTESPFPPPPPPPSPAPGETLYEGLTA